MIILRRSVLLALNLLVASISAPAPAAQQPTGAQTAGLEFFEKKIRPVLAERCYPCHSANSPMLSGQLLLDSREGLLKGGAGGPVIIRGEPEKSRLIHAIRYSDKELQMPPKARLEAQLIADFEAWVRMGAPYPDSVAAEAGRGDPPAAKSRLFWSFLPPKECPLPTVQDRKWPRNPVDYFILARLEQSGLKPSPQAEKHTLIRRATFDLTGLPPAPVDIEAFQADNSPDAFASVIDRLLASPRYGERWGRYWLDVARYADTKGYVFTSEPRFAFAYTYRNWVIRAFNEDLPYDQFLIQQIAADQLPLGQDKRPLAAMGFLTLGRRFLNNAHDIIDDRIDVVTRGTMGLTVACARCHDHKYDPIPTRDYYSLYGVFAASREPKEPPRIGDPPSAEEAEAFRIERRRLEQDIARFLAEKHSELLAELRTPAKIEAYLLAARDARLLGEEEMKSLAEKSSLNLFMLQRWKKYLEQTRDHPASTVEGDAEILRLVLSAPASPLSVRLEDVENLFNRAQRDKLTALRKKVDQLIATHPGAPPCAMTLEDEANPENPHVFLRGNPKNPGEIVPRQFPACLSGEDRRPFTQGSGRLELARAIASKENPLTARVFVNRLWLHHFGAGLVRTPSDFGLRSDPPSHPELLDYLAVRFMESGWSIKNLHRLILLSNTYQQSSEDNSEARRVDPENTLLWRMNRTRLDFEALRDSLLAASGSLDTRMGGRAEDLTSQPFSARRTIYGFIDRQNLPNLFRVFDFATPDTHSPQRFATTVPQQALFMMNSPFVIEQARRLAARREVAAAAGSGEKIRQLYRILYGRPPTSAELSSGLRFFEAEELAPPELPAQKPSPWQYGFGAYDEVARKVKSFEPLSIFTGDAWQGNAQLPDPRLGMAALRSDGGHPGNNRRQAVIRRWVAPRDGVISIRGTLSHKQSEGDGIAAWIVSSRLGEVSSWAAPGIETDSRFDGIEVRQGDTIDFIVDCRSNADSDTFRWAPVIRMTKAEKEGDEAKDKIIDEWNAASDFGGPAATPLTAWEKYAQVLLLANEFVFID